MLEKLYKDLQYNSVILYTKAKSISWIGKERMLLCIVLCTQQTWENLRFIVSNLARPGSSKSQNRPRPDSPGFLPPCPVWVFYYTSGAWNVRCCNGGYQDDFCLIASACLITRMKAFFKKVYFGPGGGGTHL